MAKEYTVIKFFSRDNQYMGTYFTGENATRENQHEWKRRCNDPAVGHEAPRGWDTLTVEKSAGPWAGVRGLVIPGR